MSTVNRGIGKVLGKSVRERIARIADDVRPPTRRRPSHLDDTVRNAAEEARHKGIAPRRKRGPGKPRGVGGRLKARLGLRFPAALEVLSEAEWRAIEAFARRYRSPNKALHNIKGYIAERMIPHLPEFGALQRDLGKRLKQLVKADRRFADLDPVVHFVRDVSAANPGKGNPWLELTDGVMVAFSREVDDAGRPKRVVILAVMESKSPKNASDLAEQGLGWFKLRESKPELKARTREPDRKWLGQFGMDFERFTELKTKFGAWEFEPDQVVISRHKNATRWVSVLPKDISFAKEELAHLVRQGFDVDQWHLPAFDWQITRVAEEVATQAMRPAAP